MQTSPAASTVTSLSTKLIWTRRVSYLRCLTKKTLQGRVRIRLVENPQIPLLIRWTSQRSAVLSALVKYKQFLRGTTLMATSSLWLLSYGVTWLRTTRARWSVCSATFACRESRPASATQASKCSSWSSCTPVMESRTSSTSSSRASMSFLTSTQILGRMTRLRKSFISAPMPCLTSFGRFAKSARNKPLNSVRKWWRADLLSSTSSSSPKLHSSLCKLRLTSLRLRCKLSTITTMLLRRSSSQMLLLLQLSRSVSLKVKSLLRSKTYPKVQIRPKLNPMASQDSIDSWLWPLSSKLCSMWLRSKLPLTLRKEVARRMPRRAHPLPKRRKWSKRAFTWKRCARQSRLKSQSSVTDSVKFATGPYRSWKKCASALLTSIRCSRIGSSWRRRLRWTLLRRCVWSLRTPLRRRTRFRVSFVLNSWTLPSTRVSLTTLLHHLPSTKHSKKRQTLDSQSHKLRAL